mgnify:CR=1 FL=1
MKIYFIYCCFMLCSFNAFTQQKIQAINAVLSDESFFASFGVAPDASTDEKLRIQTHLAYTEQLLRRTGVEHLTQSQQANRAQLLDLLHQYTLAGNFPVNRDFPGERRPCFIDSDGNICAVGYLIEQTKGRELAESINREHQYDFLASMNEPAIAAWATEYGLTLEECAMIQPTYGPPPTDQTTYADIKTGYGVSSGLVGGFNLAVNVANLSNRFGQNRTLTWFGVITGTGQVILGLANIKQTNGFSQINGAEMYTSYKAQNNLSYVNIAMGTTTIITSALNLAFQKKMKDKRNAFNLYSYPGLNNAMSMGLSFSRKI